MEGALHNLPDPLDLVWYLESASGSKKGPYSAQDILQQILDGTLSPDFRVYLETINRSMTAAEVANAYAQTTQPPAPPEAPVSTSGWQPPPKPVELKGMHIVDLNDEHTENRIGYFALISDRKKEIEKIKAERAARQFKEAYANKAAEVVRVDASTENRAANNAARVPTSTPLSFMKSGIKTGVEVDLETISPSDSNVILGDFRRKAREFFAENKRLTSIAAGFAVVFAGSYLTVNTMITPKGRLPANTAVSAPRETAGATTNFSAPSNSLGQGRNQVSHGGGSVATSAGRENQAPMNARVVPSMPNPPSAAPTPIPQQVNNEAPRDPAQFYSSSEDHLANAQEPPPTPDYNDPNAGTVQPPAYIDQNQNNGAGAPGYQEPQADPQQLQNATY